MPLAVLETPRAGQRLPRRFFVRRMGIVLAGLLLAATAAVNAGVFRWVDAQGHVHFGDKPPDKEHAQSVDIKTSPTPAQPAPDAAARRDKQQRLLRAWEEERRQRQEAAAKNKEEEARRQRNCALAKDQLRTYRDAAYLYDLDKQGKRRVLSEAEHQAAIKEAEAAVSHWCE